MHRVTLFALTAICCFNACGGVADLKETFDFIGKSVADAVERHATVINEQKQMWARVGAVQSIIITVIVLICVIAIILCCCFCSRCPGYYRYRSRSSNVARGTSGEGKENPNQINVTVDIPSHQSVIPRRQVSMGQKSAPMPQQCTRKPGPDTVTSQDSPLQYIPKKNTANLKHKLNLMSNK